MPRLLIALIAAAACACAPAGALAAAGSSTVPTTPGFTITAPATPSGSSPLSTTHPMAAARGGGVSTAAIVLAAAGGLLVLGCAGWAIHRLGGFQARWTLSLRHSVDEAGYRLAETAAELRDWARLGR